MARTLATTKIIDAYPLDIFKGDLGLEFEVEATNCVPFATKFWKCDSDGSLRGGFEWISVEGLTVKHVPTAIDEFFHNCHRLGFKFKESLRTSIHVHVNAQQYTILQVFNIITAYWLVEKLLVRYSGQTREGNLFCLRISDADFLLTHLLQAIKEERYFRSIHEDDFKYASLNLATIQKLGSLEFRSMRGCYDRPDIIQEWIDNIYSMCENASKFKNPKEIVFLFKTQPPVMFLNNFFTPTFTRKLVNASAHPPHQEMEEHFHHAFSLANALESWETQPFTSRRRSKKVSFNPTVLDWTIQEQPIIIEEDEELLDELT